MPMLLAAAALAACGGATTKPASIENTGGGPEAPLALATGFRDGALWSCQISDYDPQPCKLSRTADGWQLAKLLGSQRFAGSLRPLAGDRLAFDGESFCPWGQCTAPMRVEFEPSGPGTVEYVTAFGGNQIHLRYDDGLASEYGAAGYGGLSGREE